VRTVTSRDTDPKRISASQAYEALFTWKDFSRFVQVSPVDQGWLILWGRYVDAGRRRELAGNRTYLELAGARRRVADAVFELTRDATLVREALLCFDRTSFPDHRPLVDGNPL
jgi:hypothetical protein